MSSVIMRFNLYTAQRLTHKFRILDNTKLIERRFFKTQFFNQIKVQDNTQSNKFDVADEHELHNKLKQDFLHDENSGKVIPAFKKAFLHGNYIAIKDQTGEYSYSRLYIAAKKLAANISNICGSGSSSNIAFLCSNDVIYPLVQWACWMSGHAVVPLSAKYPAELLKYFIQNSEAAILISSPEYEKIMKPLADDLNKQLIFVDHSLLPENNEQVSLLNPQCGNILQLDGQIVIEGTQDSEFYTKSNAMILYTSGTTGKPKGVVLSHKNINAQINCLTHAWQFTPKDCLLHVLPLNHVHGSVNALMCPLSVGAKIVMHAHYDSHNIWSSLLGINTPVKDRVNVFMGVPTIYNLLIDEYNKIFAKNSRMVEYIRSHCEKNIRLMISGSAPLPGTVFKRWYDISGHRLLERYGMTEIGMALSNPYIEDIARKRTAGVVGQPLPDVEVKLVDAFNNSLFSTQGKYDTGFWAKTEQPTYKKNTNKNIDPIIGELQVKGPNVFSEYWNRPEDTKKEFVDNYFKTGDIASYANGVFKILGRSSIDIIKTGGYKVSALEIETKLLEHPGIKDVAVVGITDLTWGQKIAAIIVLQDGLDVSLETLQNFCTEKLPKYSVPTILKYVNQIPRNAMGKINKKDLIKEYFENTEDRK